MYDLLTSSVLFVLLVPGVLVSIPPGGGIWAAIVHAVVFYVVQRFVAPYVPWWAIWIVVIAVVAFKLFASPAVPTGGRR